ncbi:MAG: DNA translocase FtsK [Cyclobacteriaceae bacterium]|nr:DNA translocase FtsK 4TM domain-containing protein [Cyclobacteriaceae bacterium]MCB0498402.1 DNA translocase FtsK 4TM domain-containing protein [Cyclobacteriaceae bacterium]MCB9237028.1 DNA translocase FtsK 4TM domain-containing protein [Flammeovirgaceae bacterium]MCO5271674.1 DNA translocase FtsK [Cyclobacteriaceae bacterium]MCW5901262.1 DNA translocase FtsK 4TM domain-containing protein [Cyclobacteriaceae bacterium]
MAQNTYKSNTFKKPDKKKKDGKSGFSFFNDPRLRLALGFFLLIASFYLVTAFISYLFTGKADQSVVDAVGEAGLVDAGREVGNWLGLYGAMTSHYFIFKWFGVSAFFIPPILFLLGFKMVFKRELLPLFSVFVFSVFSGLWLCLLLGYITNSVSGVHEINFLSGGLGFELAKISAGLLGWGTFLFLVLSLFVFIIYFFNVTAINAFQVKDPKPMGNAALLEDEPTSGYTEEGDNWKANQVDEAPVAEKEEGETQPSQDGEKEEVEIALPIEAAKPDKPADKKAEPSFVVEAPKSDTDQVADKLVAEYGVYDPTMDLSKYKFPTLDLLDEYDQGKVQVTQEELTQNKDKILETLTNFKIGITSIKATIGPTVTLYEIVPEAGIKISRIKNLEDDIALSLAALGIRIIAPIPGKGTIGIEVPNKNREMVGIRQVLGTEKFMKSDKELPVALGKTISNEVLVIDLAKMPHLLVAGATGQGKSVGLNVILTSLLYKRHPSQLKFVLVDPKKVEMSLFGKIERHYLAQLPNSEEAIITDTRKVVHTLNSLCIEMENRYEMMKDAGARNLKEYNAKFVARKLNPKEGHRFLPYIVLVIDELADLMMTAGKEVETPIARLAQLARAIGIHLVVATQRPSVNVITGVIKANFPARLSFRVTSKVDSRTILDTGGADQLIGQGDMLLSAGSDIIRLQCPFVDTHEVEKICDYIGAQRGYDSAYMLPEFEGDDDKGASAVDLSERDAMFEEAARLIVAHQQGSTSLIQRKLKLGYNRAGRLIDQLEAAGVVGAFEGSKAREVLIVDEASLEQLLSELKEKHSPI